jgi:OmpA-OmpF porin, OOP family
MRQSVAVSLVSIGFLVSAAACARPADGDAHFYLGADLGQTRMDQPDVIGFTDSQDDESFTWSLKLGYRFNRHFALEGGYTDFGEFHREPGACLAVFPSVCFGSGDTSTSVDGFVLDAVGFWPVTEHLLLSGSAGVVYRTLDYHARYANVGPNSASRDGTAWKLGIGFGVPINDRLETRLDFAHYWDMGVDFDTSSGNLQTVDSGDATSVTVGLRWLF